MWTGEFLAVNLSLHSFGVYSSVLTERFNVLIFFLKSPFVDAADSSS